MTELEEEWRNLESVLEKFVVRKGLRAREGDEEVSRVIDR